MEKPLKEFNVRKYAILAWFAFIFMSLMIQVIGFLPNRGTVLVIHLLYVFYLIFTLILSKSSRSNTILLLLPVAKERLAGLRRFLILCLTISVLSILYALNTADQEYGIAMYIFYVAFTSLLSYDMLTFIVKFEREGRH
ncbi:hypothetical protein NXT3_PA00135 (plasmid) [Sinorhizobium fredii]|uniref:Transmembrane protein n=1 Tax=Rhizobium fredii TaxID=380 RepID=A0A2L0HAI6_RHIFR|nr:hypothetical protein NXT3_PA00135 [Sinorhizobium fredii]